VSLGQGPGNEVVIGAGTCETFMGERPLVYAHPSHTMTPCSLHARASSPMSRTLLYRGYSCLFHVARIPFDELHSACRGVDTVGSEQ
jgi:hypothetical protein